MSEPLIQSVIDNDMCIACGACIEACPHSAVSESYSAIRGAWEVEISDPIACTTCAAPCDTVCPSIEVFSSEEPISRRLGTVRKVWTGYSQTHRHNGISSSGGVLRALVTDQLSNGIPVIALSSTALAKEIGRTYDSRERIVYRPQLLTSVDHVDALPGSIYHSTGFYEAISLLRESPAPAAIVALPCQLAGIDRFIDLREPELRAKLGLRIGVICGWMYTDHAIANYLDCMDTSDHWIDAQYRGEDEVGKLKIITSDRRLEHDRRNFESNQQARAYLSSFSRDANRLRCRVCQDHTNVTADVAVGDAWLRRLKGEKTSIVVARTVVGEAAMTTLQSEGELVLATAREEDVFESQSRNLVMGSDAHAITYLLDERVFGFPQYHYLEAPETSKIGPLFKFNWWLETQRRRLLRQRRYRAYRWAHLLTRPRSYIDYAARKLKGIFRAGL